MRYTHDSWSIDLPNHWTIEEVSDGDEEYVTLFDPNGTETFAVTSYFKASGNPSLEEIVEFAGVSEYETADYPYLNGIRHTRIEDDEIIDRWWLAVAEHLIFVVYVCDDGDEKLSSEQRKEFVYSLRSHHG